MLILLSFDHRKILVVCKVWVGGVSLFQVLHQRTSHTSGVAFSSLERWRLSGSCLLQWAFSSFSSFDPWSLSSGLLASPSLFLAISFRSHSCLWFVDGAQRCICDHLGQRSSGHLFGSASGIFFQSRSNRCWSFTLSHWLKSEGSFLVCCDLICDFPLCLFIWLFTFTIFTSSWVFETCSYNAATILRWLLDYKFYFRNVFLLPFYLAFLRMDSIVISFLLSYQTWYSVFIFRQGETMQRSKF